MAISYTRIPDELKAWIKEGHCVPFVGSGLSNAAGLPSWDQLIKELKGEIRKDLETAAEHIEIGKCLAEAL